MVERREELRLALEAGHAFRVGDEQIGEDLDCDVAPELRVMRAIHLAHASGAEWRHDFVRAQPGSCGQRHEVSNARIIPGCGGSAF